MDGQEHDLGLWGDSTDLAGGSDAIHYRHVDVEQNDIGSQLNDFFDGFLAIFGIAANLKRMPIEKRTNGRPRGKMVIDDEDSSWHFGSDCTCQLAEGWGLRRGPLIVAKAVCLCNKGKPVPPR